MIFAINNNKKIVATLKIKKFNEILNIVACIVIESNSPIFNIHDNIVIFDPEKSMVDFDMKSGLTNTMHWDYNKSVYQNKTKLYSLEYENLEQYWRDPEYVINHESTQEFKTNKSDFLQKIYIMTEAPYYHDVIFKNGNHYRYRYLKGNAIENLNYRMKNKAVYYNLKQKALRELNELLDNGEINDAQYKKELRQAESELSEQYSIGNWYTRHIKEQIHDKNIDYIKFE